MQKARKGVMASDTSQAVGVGVTVGSAALGSLLQIHPVQIIAWCTAIAAGIVTLVFAIRREMREHRAEQDRLDDRLKRYNREQP